MESVSPELLSVYKQSKLFVSIEKTSFPYRWKVYISDEPKFFVLEKLFLFKRNAIKYSLDVTSDFTNKFW